MENTMNFLDIFFETVETLNGKKQSKRIKTSFILLCGFSFIPLGIYLLVAHEMMLGGTLVTLLAPCFLIYPIIRFFFFGGKDSVAAVVTTVVVEEVTKGVIKDIVTDTTKENRK
jgi:hypothetical protein